MGAYPCAGCDGTGVSRLCPTAKCSRCSGSGVDPYHQTKDKK